MAPIVDTLKDHERGIQYVVEEIAIRAISKIREQFKLIVM